MYGSTGNARAGTQACFFVGEIQAGVPSPVATALRSRGPLARLLPSRLYGGARTRSGSRPSDISQRREHAGVEVIEKMAVESPKPRIVGIEGRHDTPSRRHQHCVSHRAGKPLAVDLDNLELGPCKCIGCGILVWLIITSSARSPFAIGGGGTSVFQATLLIDQM
jgi:hypothetical protein